MPQGRVRAGNGVQSVDLRISRRTAGGIPRRNRYTKKTRISSTRMISSSRAPVDGVVSFMSFTLYSTVAFIRMSYCCLIRIMTAQRVRYFVGSSKLFLRLRATAQFKHGTMRTTTTLMILSLRLRRENYYFRYAPQDRGTERRPIRNFYV